MYSQHEIVKDLEKRVEELENRECECGGQNCGSIYKTTKDEK